MILKSFDIKTLRKWTPYAVEKFPPRNVTIEDATLIYMLSHDGVPMVPGSTNRFIVDHEHAAKWLNIILTVLVYIEEQVNTTT